jgi:hypothetical protein
MAQFTGEEHDTAVVDENKEAIKTISMSIKLVDKSTGEEFNLEDDEVVAVRFKERKGILFFRLKGKNGIVLSIPKSKLPAFIKVEEEKRPIW